MTDKVTKSSYVVDASVVVKWFTREENTPQARLILNKLLQDEISVFVPDLIIYEVTNALWKGKRLEKEVIIESIETLWHSKIQFEQLGILLIETVTNFMIKYDLTSYDAMYAALAYVLGVPLLSADSKAHKNIKEIEVVEL